MRITLQCSYDHAKGKSAPGEVIDVDKAEAARLIGLGVAIAAAAPAPSQKSGGTAKVAPAGDGTTPPPETGTGGEAPPPAAGGDDSATGGDEDNAGTGE